MKRTLALILALTLLFSAMLGVISFADETPAPAEATPELKISNCSIMFGDTVYLLVAVNYSQFGSNPGNITLKVTNNATGEAKTFAPDPRVEAFDNFPANCAGFLISNLGAQNMGDQLTLQAYKGGVASGKAVSYSVLDYVLSTNAKYGDLAEYENLVNLVNALLTYGAKAQVAFDHFNTVADSTRVYDLWDEENGKLTAYSYVKLFGGATFENGTTKALVGKGAAPLVASVKNGAAGGYYWLNSDLDLATATYEKTTTFTVPYSEESETYTATQFYFNMDYYTGENIDMAYQSSEAVLGQQVLVTSTSGQAVVTKGYLESITTAASAAGRTTIAFGQDDSTLGTTNYVPVALREAASVSGQITFSITLASQDKQPITDITLRNSPVIATYQYPMYTDSTATSKVANNQISFANYYYGANGSKIAGSSYGLFKLFSNTYAGSAYYVCAYYTAPANASTDTTARNAGKLSALTPVNADKSNLADAFTTYHVVFDFDTNQMRYYVNNDFTEAVYTCTLPISLDFITGGSSTYLQIQGAYSAGNSTFYKSMSITYGDIAKLK